MIIISKGETSSIAVTLNEKGLATSSCYLQLTSRFDHSVYGLTVSDVSSYPERYNLFEVYFDINPSQYNYSFLNEINGMVVYETGRATITGTNSGIYY